MSGDNGEPSAVVGIGGNILVIPLDVLRTPRDGVALTARWWVVQGGCALFWQGRRRRGWTPQCSSDRRLSESLVEHYPGSTVEFIDTAYLGREDEEWGFRLTAVVLAAANSSTTPPSTPQGGTNE